jgi:hypothetical protein
MILNLGLKKSDFVHEVLCVRCMGGPDFELEKFSLEWGCSCLKIKVNIFR